MKTIVQVICAADGSTTRHDGRYVVAWNPHTLAGICEITTTPDRAKATVFTEREAFSTWRAVSRVQRTRPWDKRPNRPLTALTVVFDKVFN